MVVARTLWLFGLSGAGKSTLADALHGRLTARGVPAIRLDGDTLRAGLCADLGFSLEDRSENIRRAAEVARLVNEAGITVVASFISPRQQDRARARDIVGADRFVDVFIDAPLSVCESRDPKGLYRRARTGAVPTFTGVSSAFERPEHPDVHIDSTESSVEDCVNRLALTLLPPR